MAWQAVFTFCLLISGFNQNLTLTCSREGAFIMDNGLSLALLGGCRAMPIPLLESGFQFQFPELGAALKDVFI